MISRRLRWRNIPACQRRRCEGVIAQSAASASFSPFSSSFTSSSSSPSSSPSSSSSSSSPSSSTSSSPSSSSSSSTLYEKLFPTKSAAPRAAATSQTSLRSEPRPRLLRPLQSTHRGLGRPWGSSENPSRSIDGADRESHPLPPGDELRAWLEHAAEPSVKPSVKPSPEAPSPSEDQSDETVIIINNAARSLLGSDFFRLSPKGRHVDGWAGGLVKVVQHASAVTREPRGQYFLFFNSRAAAEEYQTEMTRLLRVARRTMAASSTAPWPDINFHDEQVSNSDVNPEEARRFALYAPFHKADFAVVSRKQLEAFATAASRAPSTTTTQPSHQRPLDRDLSQAIAEKAPEFVPHLLKAHLNGRKPVYQECLRVLVRLVGSKIRRCDLEREIERDGVERNLPWRLHADDEELGPDFRPVVGIRAGSGRIEWGQLSEKPQPPARGYSRFVVTLADSQEARRFARSWHGRTMLDERTQREMLVQTTALW
ncbi:hypothetical protein VTI74DRAFT_11181 [Chaetomium olivicolor]